MSAKGSSFLRLVYLACVVAAATLLPVAMAGGAWTFRQDFDSGSLNVAATAVSGGLVTLEPRRFASPEWAGDHWWMYFQASGVNGATPTFRVPAMEMFQPFQSGHRFVYSYDRVNWSFFDSGEYGYNQQYYVFSNAAPFSADDVYIAYGLPYPTSSVSAHTERLRASPFVAPTTSGDGRCVLGRTAGGSDDLGRAIPPQDIYAYRISDFTVEGPKKRVVLTAGNHSGETTGNWALQGMVDFLVSDDPVAASLRRSVEFLVYPMTDPDGRYAGYFRSNPENPAKDHNRYWNSPDGFTDLDIVTAAMRADSGGEVDCFLDFHSSGWSDSLGMVAGQSSGPFAAFLDALRSREPLVENVYYLDAPGAAANWAATDAGLSAELSLTPEVGFLADWQPQRYLDLGRNYALALYEVIPEPNIAWMLIVGVGFLPRGAGLGWRRSPRPRRRTPYRQVAGDSSCVVAGLPVGNEAVSLAP